MMLTTHLCFVSVVVMVSGLQVFDQCGVTSGCPKGSMCTYRGCDGQLCLCNDGLLPDSNRTTCVQGITIGATCNGRSICQGQPFSQCINSMCQCKDGYKQTVSSTGLGTHCLPVSQGNDGKVDFVDYSDICGDKNRRCSFDLKCVNGTCLCPNETRLATNKELAASPYSYFLCRPNTFKLGRQVDTSSEECKQPDKISPSTFTTTVKSTTPSVTTKTTRQTTTRRTTTSPTTVPTSSTTPSTTTSLTTPSTTLAATTPTTLKSTATSTATSTIPQTTATPSTTRAVTSKPTTPPPQPTTTTTTKTTTVTLKVSPTTTTSTTTKTVTTASTSTMSPSSSSTRKSITTQFPTDITHEDTPTSSVSETTNQVSMKQTSPSRQSTSPTKEISTNIAIVVSSSTIDYTTEAAVYIGDSCAGRMCPNNSKCEGDSCGERRCRCQLGYATSPDRRSCFKLGALGEPCTGSNICQGRFTECTESGVCDCQSEYEPSDTGKWCRLKSRWLVSFPLLGESCSSGFFSSCYMDFEQDCVNSRCRCKVGGRDVGDEDRYAMYPDLRQCRNSSYEAGERKKNLCKNQSKQSFSTDIYDKAKAKIKKMQAAIIGGSVGFLVLVGIVIGLVVLIRWKRRGKRQVIRDTSSMASSERYSFKIPRPFTHYVGTKEYDAQHIAYPNPTFQNDSVNGESRPDLLNMTGDSSTLLVDTDQQL